VSTDPASTHGEPPPPPASEFPQPDWSKYRRQALIAAVAGFVIYLGAGFANYSRAEDEAAQHVAKQRFGMAYLSGFIYWISIPLGGMALLMIGYLAKSSWGLLLRRPMEAAIRTLPLWFILFLPLVAFSWLDHYSPYFWTDVWNERSPNREFSQIPDPTLDKRTQTIQAGKFMIDRAVQKEKELRQKGNLGFLTKPAFLGVGITLFLIWGAMIYFLCKWGRDASDESNTAKVDHALHRLEQISGPGIIVYAITITAASTQWVMSLQPGWASTMFPVIFAVNQFLTCFAFCLAFFLIFVSQPPLKNLMRPKFQLDMGTLMLAFTLFWSYTSFSQYMLVWVGNLPEEIPFFLKRSAGGWWYTSAALIAFHFALPFLLLLFRDIKLHPVRLRYVAIFLLAICAVDVVWWIQPTHPHVGYYPFYLADLGAIIGIGGVFGLAWIWQLKKRPLIPASQVFLLPEGHHEHH
jgi:hypothetical protein